MTCDIPFRNAAGMAILTRLYAEGYSSTEYADVTYSWHNGQRATRCNRPWMRCLSMALATMSPLSVHYSKLLQQGQRALDTFTTLPISTPGLFNIPIWMVPGLSQLPGADQEMKDNDITKGYCSVDPCQCKTSNVTVDQRSDTDVYRQCIRGDQERCELCMSV